MTGITKFMSVLGHSMFIRTLMPFFMLFFSLLLPACSRPPQPVSSPVSNVSSPLPCGLNCSRENTLSKRDVPDHDGNALSELVRQAGFCRHKAVPPLNPELERHHAPQSLSDWATALPAIEKYAHQGDVTALILLGRALESGLAVQRDLPLAAQAYRAAMDRGSAEAAGRLGLMGLLGTAPGLDQQQSLSLILKAADGGEADFQALLADLYLEGQLVPKDWRCFAWCLTRAAVGGNPWAMYAMGKLFEDGPEEFQDMNQAVVWYWRSAMAGHPSAASRIARMYEEGKGLPRDETQARAWYVVAINNLDPEAGLALARMCLEGRGGPRDLQRAAFWASIASRLGLENADPLVREVEGLLSPGDIQKTLFEVQSWRPEPSFAYDSRLYLRLWRVRKPAPDAIPEAMLNQ